MDNQNRLRQISITLSPYLILGVLLLIVFTMQLRIGFDLGYWSDILNFRYHFEELGIRGGMEWINVNHSRRHFLMVLAFAVVQVIFPDQSAGWYGSTFLTLYLNAIPMFLLTDSILRGKFRWLSFAMALFFVLYGRQFTDHFEFSTRYYIHFGYIIQLLSFWLYLQYVRRGRKNRWWRELSILSFFISLNFYETSAFFFVLYPLLAYLEDHRNGGIDDWRKWSWETAQDIFWFPVIVVSYLGFLMLYFPSDEIRLTFSDTIRRMVNTLVVEFSPVLIWERTQPAFSSEWLPLTLSVGVVVFLVLFTWMRRAPDETLQEQDGFARLSIIVLVVFGLGMCLLNLFIAVQVRLIPPPTSIRTLFPFAMGLAYILFGCAVLFLSYIKQRTVRQVILAGLLAINISPSVSLLLDIHQDYAMQNDERNQILDAILGAVPDVPRRATPYFLIFTDEGSNEAVYSALRADDFNFPRWFELAYDTNEFGVDVVRYNLPPPDPDTLTPEEIRRGGAVHIITTDEGIYSTLRAAPLRTEYEPNPPSDLIIIRYDHETGVAELVDEAPAELLEIANIVELVPVEWRTNYDLLEAE